MIPDVTPNGVFYLPPTGWLTSFYNPPKRNLMISSVILVIGIGNAYLQLGKYQFSGLAVAAVLGIIMNLILPQKAKSEM